MRILLLEDDEATRVIFGQRISDEGHIVVECGTTQHAIKILQTTQIDLLIVDLLVDETNSLGVVQFAGYAAPRAEVILVTGSTLFKNGELLSQFPGVSWVLRKPISADDLMAFIEYADQRRSQEHIRQNILRVHSSCGSVQSL